MNFETTLRRKAPPTKSKSLTLVQETDHERDATLKKKLSADNGAPLVATVKRNFCGTGPFDRHWFNLDCCGIFCAFITYCLHAYGVYAVCWILIPPWMNYFDDQGVRHLSAAGNINVFAFAVIALLASVSHFKAMTTDPGAVPPDASPLPEEETDPIPMGPAALEAERRGLVPEKTNAPKRLCRRCKSFKPHRAHHCSVCNRCIIKMDHHW